MAATVSERLFSMRDIKYRDFQKKLLPSVDESAVIGVRTPLLRALAKEMIKAGEADDFLESLPHRYFDENQLHAFILSEEKNADKCYRLLDRFLPYVDNWATCDQMSPKAFKKDKRELLSHIQNWLRSDHAYTVRFGLGMLMQHCLDRDFSPEYLDWAADIQTDEYYIQMMVAWFFSTALAKQYDAALPYIQNGRLDAFTHNKAIDKARESFRVTEEHKEELKKLRIAKE